MQEQLIAQIKQITKNPHWQILAQKKFLAGKTEPIFFEMENQQKKQKTETKELDRVHSTYYPTTPHVIINLGQSLGTPEKMESQEVNHTNSY